MTDDGYRVRLDAVETWARTEIVKRLPSVDAEPKPGAGEPGHTYNIAKAMAYEQRHAKEVALIYATVTHMENVLINDYDDMPRPTSDDPFIVKMVEHFDRMFTHSSFA